MLRNVMHFAHNILFFYVKVKKMSVLFKLHVSGENLTRIRVKLKGGPLWSSFTRIIDIKMKKMKIETIHWLTYYSIQSL